MGTVYNKVGGGSGKMVFTYVLQVEGRAGGSSRATATALSTTTMNFPKAVNAQIYCSTGTGAWYVNNVQIVVGQTVTLNGVTSLRFYGANTSPAGGTFSDSATVQITIK